MRRVVSLFLPDLAIERLRRLERSASRQPERPVLELPVDDDPGACSVPRGGGWRPGARWAREGLPSRADVETQIAALPTHAQPPMRELGRRSEAASHPYKTVITGIRRGKHRRWILKPMAFHPWRSSGRPAGARRWLLRAKARGRSAFSPVWLRPTRARSYRISTSVQPSRRLMLHSSIALRCSRFDAGHPLLPSRLLMGFGSTLRAARICMVARSDSAGG